MKDLSTDYLFSSILAQWHLRLTEWASSGQLTSAAQAALLLSGEIQALTELVAQLSMGDYRIIPEILLLPDAAMNGALGAYSTVRKNIYLNEDWLHNATQEQVILVLTEELGHHLDSILNQADTPGDEGELLSAIASNLYLDHAARLRVEKEDDTCYINLDGAGFIVEQSQRVTRPQDYRINALIKGYKWTSPILTYSFYAGGNYYGSERGMVLFSDEVKKSVRTLIERTIEPLINIDFVEVADTQQSYGILRFLMAPMGGYAYASAPYGNPDENRRNGLDIQGDVYLSPSYENKTDTNGWRKGMGWHGYATILHETLHALGLKHPGDYNGEGRGEPPFLPFHEDNDDNTVMNYNNVYPEPSNPMPYDIMTLQYLYGARATNNSNTVYIFDTVFGYSDGSHLVGSKDIQVPTKITLFDSGGNDTLDFSKLSHNTRGYRFDLVGGGWLTTADAFEGTTFTAKKDPKQLSYPLTRFGTRIAYGVEIENITGTTSKDIMLGNSLDNAFLGRGGNDTIHGRAGTDAAVYTGNFSEYEITVGSQPETYVVSDKVNNRDGRDELYGIEYIKFADKTHALVVVTWPEIMIGDCTLIEGSNGTTSEFEFTVVRIGPINIRSSVTYTTESQTAVAGSDFFDISDILTFEENVSVKTIRVSVSKDNLSEDNEIFYVNLSNPINCIINDGQGIGKIINDDSARPSNDNFVNRSPLVGRSISLTGSNTGATGEFGEPNQFNQNDISRSVWWTWTAEKDGKLSISTSGSGFDTTLSVFGGSLLSDLAVVVSNDDAYEGTNTSFLEFAVTEGAEYRIALDGYDGSYGDFKLSLDYIPVGPSNDFFANRIHLLGDSVTASGTNVDATSETDEPQKPDISYPVNSVWWSWTAVGSGHVVINTKDSGFDTTIGVYTGNLNSGLTEVAFNDDESDNMRTSLVNFAAIDGTTYQIAIDGYSSETGSIQLNLNHTPDSPSNDSFENRTFLAGSVIQVLGTNIGATSEEGESIGPDIPGQINSVWWNWTAELDGKASIKTSNSDFDTVLSVYSGTQLSNLTLLTSNDDTSATDKTSEVVFLAEKGRSYQISVDGYGDSRGHIALALTFAPSPLRPSNDDFENAQILTGSSVTSSGTNIGATGQAGENNHAGTSDLLNSVWWRWLAPGDGWVAINTAFSDYDTTLEVYSGSDSSRLVSVGANDDSSTDTTSVVVFKAKEGEAYHVAVDGYATKVGTINLSLNFQGYIPLTTVGSVIFQKAFGSNRYSVAINGLVTPITIQGNPIFEGMSPEWQTLSAATINDTNTVLWLNTSANRLHTWITDANWSWQSSQGWIDPNSSDAYTLESSFQLDLNGDTLIGAPLIPIESQGNTSLGRHISTAQPYVSVGNTTTPITYLGTPTSPGNTSSTWQMLAAETIGGSNKILWRYNPTGQLHVWALNSNWGWTGSDTGLVDANSSAGWGLESSFQLDLNSDSIIGAPLTPIESQGNTSLGRHISTAQAYVSVGNTATPITYFGTPSSPGNASSTWQMLAAETIGGTNKLLWRYNPTSQLHVWALNSSWGWTGSDTGLVDANSSAGWGLESSFQLDLNSDSIIGAPLTPIELQGNTSLGRHISTAEAYVSVGNSATPITYQGTPSSPGNASSTWQMLAAETIGGTNKLLWRYNPTSQLHVWALNSSWGWTDSDTGLVDANSSAGSNLLAQFGLASI